MIITQTQVERDFTSHDGKIIEVYHQPILDMDRSKFDPIQIRYYKQFKNLREGIHSGDWFLDKNWQRTYCREFYQACFSDTPNIPTHLMSKRAMNKLLLKGGSFDVLPEDHVLLARFLLARGPRGHVSLMFYGDAATKTASRPLSFYEVSLVNGYCFFSTSHQRKSCL